MSKNKSVVPSVTVFIALVFASSAWPGQAIPAQQNAVKTEKPIPTEPPARKQKPLSAQQAIGAFWRTDHTFNASIRITNNLSLAPLIVMPVLYMADGTEYPLIPVQVLQLSVVTVSVNDALAAAPPKILSHLSNYGSATLQYIWRWGDAVSGSILSLDVPRSLIFTSRFVAGVVNRSCRCH